MQIPEASYAQQAHVRVGAVGHAVVRGSRETYNVQIHNAWQKQATTNMSQQKNNEQEQKYKV